MSKRNPLGLGRRRYVAVLVRMTPEERATIREHAQRCGRGLGPYLLGLGLGHHPAVPRSRSDDRAVYHLARVGNNLNQLARVANTTGRLGEATLIEEALAELKAVLGKLVEL